MSAASSTSAQQAAHPSQIEALILAGGLGTRLRSVVSDRPKVLAEVAGRAWIFHLLDQLESAAFKRVILCTGYMAEKVEALLGCSYRGMALEYSLEQTALGTGGAIRNALPKLQSDTFLVLNGDSYCALDFGQFAQFHQSKAASLSMVVVKQNETARYGSVLLDADQKVQGFAEKNSQSGPGWINAGIYMLSRDLITNFKTAPSFSLERELFPLYIGKGFYAFKVEQEGFIDIGTPDSFQQAQKLFRRG